MSEKTRKIPPLHSRLRAAIRKAWLQSPERNQAVKNARVARGLYRCVLCGSIVGTKEYELDHIVPVGPTPGSKKGKDASWDDFIARLFCDPSGLQAVCKKCHAYKTKLGHARNKDGEE